MPVQDTVLNSIRMSTFPVRAACNDSSQPEEKAAFLRNSHRKGGLLPFSRGGRCSRIVGRDALASPRRGQNGQPTYGQLLKDSLQSRARLRIENRGRPSA